MSSAYKSLSLMAGAGLLFAASSGAAQACASASFITTGCFTTITIVNAQGGGDPGFQWIGSNGKQDASLTLAGSSTPITSVTFDFKEMSPTKAFNISLTNFALAGGATFFSVPDNDTSLHTLTFFAQGGPQTDLAFIFYGANPNSVEVGNIVATSAPAPIPGGGFLSFLGIGLAGLWRRGKSAATRLLGVPQSTTA
jgi:hypothetical protein